MNSFTEFLKLQEDKEADFEPHMMYDPETGKEHKAKTYADHVRMKKLGYDHEKPTNESRTVDLEKANELSYDEYEEVQNFKNFNKRDWKRNRRLGKYVRKNKV